MTIVEVGLLLFAPVAAVLSNPLMALASLTYIRYTATVMRKLPEDKLGITLKRNPGDGTTVIGKINPEGLFASSKLKEGMQVVSVNNVQASESTLYDLLDVLKGADGPITILAKEDGGPTPPTAPQRGSLRDLLFGAEEVKSAGPLKQCVNRCSNLWLGL